MQKTKDHPFKAVRTAAVPIVAWETADPQASISGCMAALNGNQAPALVWDCIRGLRGINSRGQELASNIGDPLETQNCAQCLSLIADKYTGSNPPALFFLHAGNRVMEDWTAVQAIWNLRDRLEGFSTTLVLLGPSFRLPAELKQDCVVISEELPGEEQLLKVAEKICKDNEVKLEDSAKAVDTLRGLSAFAAKQVVALSIVKDNGGLKLDMSALWERKRRMIEQTPGLSVWRGGERFDDIGGCENIKTFLRKLFAGKNPPLAICFCDELEKSMPSGGLDTSGVSQDYLRTLLTYMQDRDATGMIFVGPPGAAKSAIAKAAGNDAGVITIALDLGGMKGSLVGESEQRLRNALQIIDAVSQSRVLFIGTCNSISILPPELKRRFTLGTFFFALPSSEDRDMIWKIYEKKFSIPAQDRPDDEGWSGAEIKQCSSIAWRLQCSLAEASKFIVPVAVSAADSIDKLCREASRKFISASRPGLYEYRKVAVDQSAPAGRKLLD